MAPLYLPRVGAFPIFSENHPVTVMGTSTQLPLTVKKDFPLKGKVAPDFVLSDHLGKSCSLHATIQLGRPIILFFFPLAGSPHCTSESCLFRDAIALTPIFSDLQAIVIGISQDTPTRAKRFVEEHRLGYRILCDEKRKVMEAYGVTRTTFGLVDNRSTFIIDPSGLVRGLAEGVLNSRGHLKFAEQWLIQLEHELSERSRQCHEVIATDNDMIANMHSDALVQVIYGQERSAEHGGIGGTPRYGSMVAPASKLPSSPSHRRSASLEEKKKIDMTNDEKAEHANSSSNSEKNMWRNWKFMLSQLSSPDDKPPPLAIHTRSRSASTATAPIDPPASPTTSMTRSRTSAKMASPKATPSPRRSRSRFGSRRQSRVEADINSVPVPPLPKDNIQIKEATTKKKLPLRVGSVSTDDESNSVGFPSIWGTDTSIEGSGKSTAPSSYADHSRGSHSLLHQSLLSSPKRGSKGLESRLSTPPPRRSTITSEILMVDQSPESSTKQRKSTILSPEDVSRYPMASPSPQSRADRSTLSSPMRTREGKLDKDVDIAKDFTDRMRLIASAEKTQATSGTSSREKAGHSTSTSDEQRKRMHHSAVLADQVAVTPNSPDLSQSSSKVAITPRSRLSSVNRAMHRASSGGIPLDSSPTLSRSMDRDSPLRGKARSMRNGSIELDYPTQVSSGVLSTQSASPRVTSFAARSRDGSVSSDIPNPVTPKRGSLGSSNSLVLQSLSTLPFNASQYSLHSAGSSTHDHSSRRSSNAHRAAIVEDHRSSKLAGWTETPLTQTVPIHTRQESAQEVMQQDTPSRKDRQEEDLTNKDTLFYNHPHRPSAIGIASGLPMTFDSSSPLSATASDGVEDQYTGPGHYQYSTAYDPQARRSSQADSIKSTGTFG